MFGIQKVYDLLGGVLCIIDCVFIIYTHFFISVMHCCIALYADCEIKWLFLGNKIRTSAKY